ncbi:MAG: hypothetical protein JXA60_09540 [Candidatus Coatesbacteria bacterium]|nr:hypothetical protein [Candidatus Coatesbacteria bacterium]
MKKLVLIITVLFLTGIILAKGTVSQISFEGFLTTEKNKTGIVSEYSLYDKAIHAYNGLPRYVKTLSNPLVNGYNLTASPYNPAILQGLYYRVKSVNWNEYSFTFVYEIINKGYNDLKIVRWDRIVRSPKDGKFLLPSNGSVTIEVTSAMPGYGNDKPQPEAKVIIYNSNGWAMFDPMPVRRMYTNLEH